MPHRLRTAVIGCGKVGHFHARAFRDSPWSELVACCNHNLQRAEEFAQVYGILPYDDPEKMIRECGVDAAAICTPHPNHAEASAKCARMGVHIAIEKPLASTLEDCDIILSAARAAGVTGTTISQRRFYPAAMRVKCAIDAGKIGRPVLGTVNMLGWRSMDYYHSDPWRGTWKGEGGGVLVNQAPHQLDLLLWYMGDIEELYGAWDTLNHPNLEVDDTAAAVIRFKSGALGNIVVSNSQNPALFGNVRVHGANGASIGVQTDGGAMFIAGVSGIAEQPYNDLWTVPGEEGMPEAWKKEDSGLFQGPEAVYRFHRLQLDDFLLAAMENRDPLVTLEDGRKTVELFTAIYRSSSSRSAIRFPLRTEEGASSSGRPL
jgi:UDP-N-acetyl-2-amino-2-deoxyglucuronate dehydrogenase